MMDSAQPSAAILSTRTYFTSGTDQPSQLAQRLVQELARRWSNGQQTLAEELLAEHPELYQYPEAAIQVICEEVCLRQEHGLEIHSAELARRFPQCRSQVRMLVDCHRLLQEGAPPAFPKPGEMLGDFELLSELGRGALGHVYLARQADLADRLMVLKVAPRGSQEHLSLARLQHTHIVPLYHVQEELTRSLQILCLPYFGGVSLDRVLAALRDVPLAARRGSDILAVLDRQTSSHAPSIATAGPARAFLARASFTEAIGWIGACLADALHYAHERGLLHLDVKPANVLLAADGQPMLLDFHLAIEPMRVGQVPPLWFGGTSGFMSPEQGRVMAKLKARHVISEPIDRQSDIYSLGLLLYQVLAGGSPVVAVHALRRANPQVSVGLMDIIAHCLRPDPQDRYPDAAAVSADLRRHLTHQPLLGVPNRSLRERWRKWRRRRPHALTVALLLGGVLAAAGGTAYLLRDRHQGQRRRAEQALTEGRALVKEMDYAAAVRAFGRGLEQVEPGPLKDELRAARTAAHQAQLGHELHLLADRVRFIYDSAALAPERLTQLADACQSLWQARQRLGQPDAALRQDLLDLAILWADLRVRAAAPGEHGPARQEALRILEEAETALGTSLVLCRERQRHAAALGNRAVADEAARAAAALPPQSAWEEYALGRSLLRAGQISEAEQHFQRAVDLQPDGYWPNFYQGVCAYRQGQHHDAVAAFRTCVALAPGQADSYFNRGLAWQALGLTGQAKQDFDRAIQMDSTMAAAWLNRGIIQLAEKHPDPAIDDLQQALRHGGARGLIHFNLALAYQAKGDRGRAWSHIQKAVTHRPDLSAAQELYRQLDDSR